MAKTTRTAKRAPKKKAVSRKAKDTPVLKTSQVDTTDHQIGQDVPRDLPSTGEARLDAPLIEEVDGPINTQHMDEMMFMEEPVDVLVHESTNPNDEFIVETYCNGRAQYFMRGVATTVKRKFVGVLARAKQTSYTQQRYKDAEGNDAIRNVPHTALRYPFSVVADSNPKGADWLRKTLAEA